MPLAEGVVSGHALRATISSLSTKTPDLALTHISFPPKSQATTQQVTLEAHHILTSPHSFVNKAAFSSLSKTRSIRSSAPPPICTRRVSRRTPASSASEHPGQTPIFHLPGSNAFCFCREHASPACHKQQPILLDKSLEPPSRTATRHVQTEKGGVDIPVRPHRPNTVRNSLYQNEAGKKEDEKAVDTTAPQAGKRPEQSIL